MSGSISRARASRSDASARLRSAASACCSAAAASRLALAARSSAWAAGPIGLELVGPGLVPVLARLDPPGLVLLGRGAAGRARPRCRSQ